MFQVLFYIFLTPCIARKRGCLPSKEFITSLTCQIGAGTVRPSSIGFECGTEMLIRPGTEQHRRIPSEYWLDPTWLASSGEHRAMVDVRTVMYNSPALSFTSFFSMNSWYTHDLQNPSRLTISQPTIRRRHNRAV